MTRYLKIVLDDGHDLPNLLEPVREKVILQPQTQPTLMPAVPMKPGQGVPPILPMVTRTALLVTRREATEPSDVSK
jgi:hypothetical protein